MEILIAFSTNVKHVLIIFLIGLHLSSDARAKQIDKTANDNIVKGNLLTTLIDHQSDSQKNIIPESFGKTHFIVGMSQQEMKELQQKPTDALPNDSSLSSLCSGHVCHAFFSPDDGIEHILTDLIDHEQKSMLIAVFAFTDIEIARALIRAQERGVSIEIVTDPSCLQDKFNKITLLKEQKVPIYIYNADDSKATLSNRMHHKFVIFRKNMADKQLIWLGSYNFTKSAHKANQESVVLLENPALVEQFLQQFNRLKERSIKFDDFAKNHFIVAAYKPVQTERVRKKTSVAHNKKLPLKVSKTVISAAA